MNSPNLALPFLAASQAQKHVTVNDALTRLDGLVQLSVKDRNLTAPPVSPTEGDRYIVATNGSGAWAGWDGDVVLFTGGAWMRLQPKDGWIVWVEDESLIVNRSAGSWNTNVLLKSNNVEVARGALGGAISLQVIEETLSGLSGATVDSTVVIPNRSICLGVSTRVVTTITGPANFHCGISGTLGKFGSYLDLNAGSINIGVIGPQAFYADTPIVLAGNQGNFNSGAVAISIYVLTFAPPA
ncbi:DUF2793 domain-containing protein [Profundibacter sp.]